MRLRNRQNGEHGAMMVEAAIALPIYLTMIVGLMDMGRIAYHSVAMQFAVSSAARWGVIGRGTARTADNIAQEVINYCGAAGLNVERSTANYEVFVCRLADRPCTRTNHDAGGPDEWIIIEVSKTFWMFFGNQRIDVVASAIMKNEPYTQ